MKQQGDITIAERHCILRATVGSTLHGLAVPGTDDRDQMGVCIEPPEYVVGLQQFEQYVYRDADEGERSKAGDLDLTIYSLRKFCRLALNGNPSVLLLLYAPQGHVIVRSRLGDDLQTLAPAFASKRAVRAFLGYTIAQKERLLGERGQMRVKRPELIEAHGFDTKYAMHVLRLTTQGVEYAETGRITLPMPEPERTEIFDVRMGRVSFNDVMTKIGIMEKRLEDALAETKLPEDPDRAAIDRFLIRAYSAHWSRNGMGFVERR